jgi:hypothetical protein
VEFYARKRAVAMQVSGEVRWELLAQSLVLSPDYEAVVGYLMLNPYHMPQYGV